MKMVGKLLFLLLFVWASPLCILLISIRVSGYSAPLLKKQLIQAQVYNQLVQSLDKNIDAAIQKGASDDPLRLIGPFLKREVTSGYVQMKVEKLIDDTKNWLVANAKPPELSFADLKEKLLRQNPLLLTALTQLGEELKKQKPQGAQVPIDIPKLLESDITIPIGKQMGWIKTLYMLSTTGFVFLAGALVFLLAGLIFLSDTRARGLKWAGTALLMSFLWNITPLLIAAGSSRAIPAIIREGTSNLSVFVAPVLSTLIGPVVMSYSKVGAIGLAILLGGSIACFLAARNRDGLDKG